MDLGAAHSEDHLAINRGAESSVSNAALVYCAVPSVRRTPFNVSLTAGCCMVADEGSPAI